MDATVNGAVPVAILKATVFASANETFSVTDESGIPVLAYNVDGTLLLSPFSGSTSVGTKKSVGRLHVKPDGNSPAITIPDETNPRYSVGFGSVNVSGVGQRLDFYAGDSLDNETNLGTNQLRMSLTANGDLGLATNNPGSMVDIRPIVYSSNQPSEGYQLGTTGGQWISKFFMRSDSGGTPYTGIATPADSEGDVHETFQVAGAASAYIRIRPGGTDNLLSASVERVNINRDIVSGNDTRSVLEVDGGIRIRDTQGGESPSKPGHFGLWDSNINASWKWLSSTSYDSMNSAGIFRDVAYVDYKPLTTWRANYLKYNTLVYRLNNIDNPSLNGLRLSPRMQNKEYSIASIVGNNGNIDNTTGIATSGTPTVLTLTEDISAIYGPFPVTNVTGWPTTAPSADANGNFPTYDVYVTLGTNAQGEAHDIERGTGVLLTGIGGGLDNRSITIFRIQGDRRLRLRVNGSVWTGPAGTSGSCRAVWIRTAIRDCGGATTSQSVSWNWLRTWRFKTDAANPARTLTISGNFSDNNVYPDVNNQGFLRVYRDYSSSHYMYREQYDIGAGNQSMGWSDYCPTHTTFNYTRTGNNNMQQYAASYTGTGQSYRGHTYNLYGAYVPNLKGVDIYNRNYRNGRNNSQIGYYSEVRNGLYNDSAGYTGFASGFYAFMPNRGTARTNDMRGCYVYLRAGENTSAHRAVVNNARGFYSLIRADGGTITTAYLYQGAYGTGSNNPTADPPTQSVITTKRGIWLTGCTDSRIDGNLELNGETATLKANRIACFTGAQELILAAGESINYINDGDPTHPPNITGESVFNLAENGIVVYSSSGNWINSGRVLRTGTFCNSAGNGSLPGTLSEGSDARLKSNIRNIPDALSKVMNMRGAIFNRIDKENQEEIGLIAQEVEQVLPQVVEETDYMWEGDKMKSIGYGKIVGLLIEAMKEQQAQIEDLKARLG